MPRLEVGLSVTFHREGKYFVAHSPALDLSTAGRSLEEAQQRFSEAAGIFFEETSKDPVRFDRTLRELGWVRSKRRWSPPVTVAREEVNVRIPA